MGAAAAATAHLKTAVRKPPKIFFLKKSPTKAPFSIFFCLSCFGFYVNKWKLLCRTKTKEKYVEASCDTKKHLLIVFEGYIK